MERQVPSAQRGLLQGTTAQRHEPPRYRRRLCRRHLPPGIQDRNPHQVQQDEGSEGIVPGQAVLHLQYAHHARVGLDQQRLPYQSDAVQPIPREPPRQAPRCLGGEQSSLHVIFT